MTNEQRAHDIAISMLPTSLEIAKAEATSNPERKLAIDVIDVYIKTYISSLNALNEKFPEE